jgi:DNA polymerase-3 subunit alpha
MNHSDIPKQDLINERLIELHRSFDVPIVAANGVYYIEKDDKKTQDVIMCQGSGHTLDNPDRPTMIN